LIVNKEQRFPDIAYDGKQIDVASKADAMVVHGQDFTPLWGHSRVLKFTWKRTLARYAGVSEYGGGEFVPMNADVYDMAHAKGALVGEVHPLTRRPMHSLKPAQTDYGRVAGGCALEKLDYMEIVGFSDHRGDCAVCIDC